jgi:ABC-2 type transport system ATP-binding protein
VTKLELQHVQKHFNTGMVLQDINLTIDQPQIYGLFGRNQAGKTTLFRLITQQISPDSGAILLDNQLLQHNANRAQEMTLSTQNSVFAPNLTLAEILKWAQKFQPTFQHNAAKKTAIAMGLNLNQLYGRLSTGAQIMFKTIFALMTSAEIVLLDEPTLGLDAAARDKIYQLIIDNFTDHPRSIVIASHLIDEITNLITQVLILNDGVISVDTPLDTLLAQAYILSGPENTVKTLTLPDKLKVTTLLGTTTVLGQGTLPKLPADVTLKQPNLQNLFIGLTQPENTMRGVTS